MSGSIRPTPGSSPLDPTAQPDGTDGSGAPSTAPARPRAPRTPAAPAPADLHADRLAAKVTAFYRKAGAATASAAEGEVAAREVAVTEAGTARPGENLAPIEAYREVYVNAAGHFVTSAAKADAPASLVELGEGLYRAASIVDDTKENLFAAMPLDVRERMLGNLTAALAQVPAGGPPPAGLDETQAKQLRSSAATVLLELLDSLGGTRDVEAPKERAFAAYIALARAETEKVLRQSMATNLDAKLAAGLALAPAQRAEAATLLESAFPTKPPYEQWFASGNDTVRIAFSCGPEFPDMNARMLERDGWRRTSSSPDRFAKEILRDGRLTKFEVTLRVNRSDMFREMADPSTHVVAYDGHANWGRNVKEALAGAPDMAGAKVALIGLCSGKGELNLIEEKYPDSQTITTWNSSYFNTIMEVSDNFGAITGLVNGIAARADWETIRRWSRENAPYSGSWTVHNNSIFPTDLPIRRRVLDRDHDGQADHFDRFVDFSTFRVAEDAARDFEAKDPGRPADSIVGTRVHIAAMGINRNSHFNEVTMYRNPAGNVVDDGFFEPKAGEREIIRFEKDRQGDEGVVRMRVNARFAHMSEESLRALAMYEWNRFLAAESAASPGGWPLDAVGTKLHGLVLLNHSLYTDSGYRDDEVWTKALSALGFPEMDRSIFERVRAQDYDRHSYAGSEQGVAELRALLPPAVLARLADPAVGVPNAG